MLRLFPLFVLARYATGDSGESGESGDGQDNRVNEAITMPDLGRRFWLGELYDVVKDQSIGGSMWPLHYLRNDSFVEETPARSADYKFAYSDSIQSKMELFNIDGELAFKYGIGVPTFDVKGSAEYLSNKAESNLNVRTSVKMAVRTKRRSLNIFDDELKPRRFTELPKQATHFVSSILYGADAVAIFEQTASNEDEKSVLSGSLGGKMKLAMIEAEARVRMDIREEETFSSKEVKIYLHGDVVPGQTQGDGQIEAIPTDYIGALEYLSKIHISALLDGGVPMQVVLTPISFLDGPGEKIARKITKDLVNKAVNVAEELDESLRIMNDLSARDNHGFKSWTWGVESFKQQLQNHQLEFKANLSRALYKHRKSTIQNYVVEALDFHYTSNFTKAAVQKYQEEQYDALHSMSSLVMPLEEDGGATLARRFSDYMGPTMSADYDAVVALLLSGMSVGASTRSAMASVRQFLAFGRNTIFSQNGAKVNCKRAILSAGRPEEQGPGAEECVEKYKLVVVHFDSYCEQFCPGKCSVPPICNSSASSDWASWCSNPCTRVVAHYKQGPAVSAESLLPPLPEAPSITKLVAGPMEADPNNQHIELEVQTPEGFVLALRVRIIRHEYYSPGNSWRVHHRTVDVPPDARIVVTGLAAGGLYTFQVAAVNEVDEGPFSPAFPPSAVEIASRKATIQPAQGELTASKETTAVSCKANSEDALTVQNRAPNWIPWKVKVSLSSPPPANVHPAVMEFTSSSGEGFRCLGFHWNASRLEVECTIPCQKSRHPNQLNMTVWDSNMARQIAHGELEHQEMSETSCRRFVPNAPVFCNVSDPKKRRCMPRTNASQLQCAQCNDPLAPTTQLVNPFLCTASNCDQEQIWCPSLGICMSQTTCEAGCASGSIERDVGAGKFCALPCVLSSLPDSVVPASFQVLAGQSTEIKCLDGFRPVWDSASGAESISQTRFECDVDNVQSEVDVSQLMLDLPECVKPCSAGSASVGRANVQHPVMLRGETKFVDCPVHEYYVPQVQAVKLLCNPDSQIQVVESKCKARPCAAGHFSLGGGVVQHGEIAVNAAKEYPCPKTDAYSGGTVEVFCNTDRKVTWTAGCQADTQHNNCKAGGGTGNNWPIPGNCRRRRNEGSKCFGQYGLWVVVEREYNKEWFDKRSLSKQEIFDMYRGEFEEDCKRQAEERLHKNGKTKEAKVSSWSMSNDEDGIRILEDHGRRRRMQVKFNTKIPCFPTWEFCS
ncbi:unnamed protein product [Symbiodinium sp. CCMP2592]|nr:unnamed protein product [Symbiodinium sp. CCMP2592]